MRRIKFLQLFILPATLLLFAGCEKDKITAPFSVKTENNAKLLLYLEEEGDIINRISCPSIPAEEVFNNLNIYLIIDVRENSDYLAGHIAGAKNILNDSLYNYIEKNSALFDKIVLISASGQSAAYYSALLRLAGFPTIFYMNFGMASWNILFSSVWTDRLNTEPDTNIFSYYNNPKGNYNNLPELQLTSTGQSIKDYVRERISSLIKDGFDEDYNSGSLKTSVTFRYWQNIRERLYTICTGQLMLYVSNPFIPNTYHPVGAVFYQAGPGSSDFRSTSYLQTIPSSGTIAMYSGTGQESAFYTAYLRLLGYDAKSILFGMNNIDYNMLFHHPDIMSYAFTTNSIMNYPYKTGPERK